MLYLLLLFLFGLYFLMCWLVFIYLFILKLNFCINLFNMWFTYFIYLQYLPLVYLFAFFIVFLILIPRLIFPSFINSFWRHRSRSVICLYHRLYSSPTTCLVYFRSTLYPLVCLPLPHILTSQFSHAISLILLTFFKFLFISTYFCLLLLPACLYLR